MENDGFLRRWSRLKSVGNEPSHSLTDTDHQPARQADRPASDPGIPAERADAAKASVEHAPAADSVTPPAALPTLEDAKRLTTESDYSEFMKRGVDKAARRMALKKLFADPHFNQLDGLDIYMSDYNCADPLPAPMLAALRQAQDFLQEQAGPEDGSKGAEAGQPIHGDMVVDDASGRHGEKEDAGGEQA
jgi:hypothetical protein